MIKIRSRDGKFSVTPYFTPLNTFGSSLLRLRWYSRKLVHVVVMAFKAAWEDDKFMNRITNIFRRR